MTLSCSFAITALALGLEAALGYPDALFRAIGHPVTWIGALIGATERRFNRPQTSSRLRRMSGILSLLFWLLCTGAIAGLISWVCGQALIGSVILIVLATSLLAQRALHAHVEAVADALESGGVVAGRAAVSRIVGRATGDLDETAVARAAIESLAENFSDGVVAPAFWLALGGLAGGVLYKTINTADSMVGHRTQRFANYGWASARLDDLVNLPAARLAALFLAGAAAFDAAGAARAALAAARRDAPKHPSPNAGWPEAAMAGALGLKLGGPRIYGDEKVDGAFMGDGRAAATIADIRAALRLFRRAALIQISVYLILAALVLSL